MAWIESHAELRDHPKRKRLSRRLGLDMYQTIGLLNCVWWWVMDYAPDGDLSRYEAEDVADGIDYPGDPAELLDALRFAGFIDGMRIHDWEEYGEKLFRRRKANAERMKSARAEHVPRTCDTHAEREDRTGQTGQTEQEEEGPPPPVEKSPKEAAVLAALAEIPGYPLDEDKDLALLRESHDSRVDVVAEVRKFRDFHEPKWAAWKKRSPPNYRLAWRNWLQRADRFALKDHGPIPAAHTTWRPPAPEEPGVPEIGMPTFVREAMAGIGRSMG
jgi:hypothetical protein